MQDSFIAADQCFSDLVNQITAEQWSQTVPATPDWTVQQLVGHVTENNKALTKVFGVNDELIQDMDSAPADAWRESAADAETSTRAILNLDEIHDTPLGKLTAEDFLNAQLTDRVIHSYDLAQAIGADTTMDPELAKLAYDFTEQHMESMRGNGIGPRIDVDNDATYQAKLLGLSGRDPSPTLV